MSWFAPAADDCEILWSASVWASEGGPRQTYPRPQSQNATANCGGKNNRPPKPISQAVKASSKDDKTSVGRDVQPSPKDDDEATKYSISVKPLSRTSNPPAEAPLSLVRRVVHWTDEEGKCKRDCPLCKADTEKAEKEEGKMRALMRGGRISLLTSSEVDLRMIDGRPWAEPPSFHYVRFRDDFVPSDKLIMDMFPTDLPARTTFRDVKTEYKLLQMFSEWGSDVRTKTSSGCFCNWRGEICDKCNFHATLIAELQTDLSQFQDENGVVDQALTPLQVW